jgi:hypothetical protein
MRRIFIACVFPLVLASCSEAGNAPTEAKQKDEVVDAQTMADVLRLVRKFSTDMRASVSSLKRNDTIVCGVARVRGEKQRFYVDLVDEEAFLASDDDTADALIRTACS